MPFGKTGPRSPEFDSAPFADGTQLVDRIASELDLLSRNVEILERLGDKNPLGIIRLSEALRLPIHKVRYSLHLLEREGVIQPSAEGALLTDKARQFWIQLDESLDRMSALVLQLKQKASAHQGKPSAGPKGY
ncbi:MAG TPA: transcriptional regulator [Thermoplasmata archaeon]|nr:transcriptional regulator [Thermoplasmata archaeon]